jgi:signal transduction histidine kinase
MKEKALQVLLVEDNAGDVRLLREMFSKEKEDSFELTHFLRMSDAVIHLAKGGVDIVLLDMGLPDGHGVDTVRRAHAAAPGVPLIVLTGLDDEALAAEAMKEGAQDYLIKGQIENRALPRALRHAIERHRMQTETDLIRTQQMQFKDEFLSHVSHELCSPLTAIYQFVTILSDRLAGGLNLEQHEYLEIVLRNVKQLQSMIDDLLEVTRVQAGKLTIELQCTSVPDAIAYTLATLQGSATAKGIVLSSDQECRLPLVWADPTRLRQILIILIDNAIKFTPPNGVVKVQARVLDEDSNLLVLEVSDSGCGISPDMTERIFERLFQVSDPALAGRKGLGLGLHICKELVTRQGGQIWAQSTPGQGAVLSVTLPIFSLSNLIAPLLRNEAWPVDSVALMSVEIGSQDGWLSNEKREEWSRESRILVQKCLLPDLDMLLPKMDSGGAGEVFFVLVFANDNGAAVLAKRIREQFGHLEQFKQAGLTFSVSYKFLSPAPTDVAGPLEDIVGKMAARIGTLIKSEIHTRSNHHE